MTTETAIVKLKPSAVRLLRALQQAGRDGLTNVEIAQPDVAGLGYSARLAEVEAYVKQRGLCIERKRISNSRWRYILTPYTGAAGVDAAGYDERSSGVDSGGSSEGSRDQESPAGETTGISTSQSDPPGTARLFDPAAKRAA